MPDIIPHQQQPERLHKFHSLKGGQYWRAKNDIPEQCIEPRQPGGCKLKTAPVRPVVAARPAE
ncbi:hypothetical protein ACJWVB_26255, partial [Klebsiella pneumoniae]